MRDRDLESGIAPYVRVGGGFLEVSPASLPDSRLRFFKGQLPAIPGVPLTRRAIPGEEDVQGVERRRCLTGAASSSSPVRTGKAALRRNSSPARRA